jgi:hypothetical protein
MTLWHFMMLVAFFTPVWGALTSARSAGKGWIIYALALAIGVLVGSICAWAMQRSFRVVQMSGSTRAHGSWCFRALYTAAPLWIGVAGLVGFWLTRILASYI